MKKRLVGLALLLAALMYCLSAQAADYTADGLFTVSYDETRFTLDRTSYTIDCTATYKWLFLLHDGSNVIDVSTETIPEYAGFSLHTADDAVLSLYQQDVLSAFADQNAVFVSRRTVSALQVPFYIFRLQDEEGTYYLAETVLNGVVIDFLCYPAAMNAVDETHLDLLCRLLDTFVPLGAESGSSL